MEMELDDYASKNDDSPGKCISRKNFHRCKRIDHVALKSSLGAL